MGFGRSTTWRTSTWLWPRRAAGRRPPARRRRRLLRPRRPRRADDVLRRWGCTGASCVYPPGPRQAGIHLRTQPGAFTHMPDDPEDDAPDNEEFDDDEEIELDDAEIDEEDLEDGGIDDDD